MSALKSIRMRNIQSHKDTLIELPEIGLVVFQGGNSEGKSVLTRVLEDVISNGISNVKARRSLINRDPGVQSGTLELVKYDGSKLLVNLHRDASQTWVCLTRANGEEVKRYLADKTIPELVSEFGFHYNKERDVTLNICDSDEAILFFKTNYVTNYDVVSSALVDTVADRKSRQLMDLYQESMSTRRTVIDNLNVANAARDSLIIYDDELEARRALRLRRIVNILSHVYIPNIEELPDMPKTPLVVLPPIQLKKLRTMPVISLPQISISRLDEELSQLESIEKGVCPTCGRPFYSHQTCTKEM